MSSMAEIQNTMRVITDIHARYDVNIHFDRRMCFTNGKDIWINAGDPSDEVWRRLVEAKITHEAGGHLKHSDFGVFKSELQGKSQTFLSVNNIIEDCRVETACMNEFSGAYWVFQKMTYDLLDEGYFQVPGANDTPASLLFAWLLYTGRGLAVDGQAHLKNHGDDARYLLEQLGVPSDIFDEIEERMVNWGALKSTKAAIDETITIMAMLKRLSKEQPQPPKQLQQQQGQGGDSDDESDDNQDSGSGDKSESTEQSEDDSEKQSSGSGTNDDSDDETEDESEGLGSGSDGKSDENSNGQGDSSDSDGDSSGQNPDSDSNSDTASSNQSAAGGAGSNPLSDEEFHDLGEALQDLHDLMNKAIDKHAKETPASNDAIDVMHVTHEVNSNPLPRKIENGVNQGARTLKRIIESQLWAKEAQPRLYDESGSDFDDDLLAGIPAGNSRIFYSEDIVETYKSSFVIAIDLSGSMGIQADKNNTCTRLDVAQEAALSIAAALEELDVPVAVLYFNDTAYIGKSFSQTLDQCYRRIGIDVSGGTETQRAISAARKEFAKLDDADRKQLLIVTDGCPYRLEAVESQIEHCKMEGIDVASINIQEEKYGGIENYKVIDNVSELPEVMDEMIRENLLSAIQIN